jgi:hypothetical protein
MEPKPVARRKDPVPAEPESPEQQHQDLWSLGAKSIADAVTFTSLSQAKLYLLMADGTLPYSTVDRRRVLPVKALIALMAKNTVADS